MAFPHVDIIMKQKDRILWIKNHCERLVELLSTDQNGLKDQVTFDFNFLYSDTNAPAFNTGHFSCRKSRGLTLFKSGNRGP